MQVYFRFTVIVKSIIINIKQLVGIYLFDKYEKLETQINQVNIFANPFFSL